MTEIGEPIDLTPDPPEPVEVVLIEGYRVGRSSDPQPAVLLQAWNGDGDAVTVAVPAMAMIPLVRDLLDQLAGLNADIIREAAEAQRPKLEVIEKQLHVARAVDNGMLP